VNLATHVEALVLDALEKYKFPFDEVDHTVNLVFAPAGPQGMVPGWGVMLVVKSPIIGQVLSQLTVNLSPKPTTEEIDQLVMNAMDQLRSTRAQVMNGSGKGETHQ
jgi:hypothetical protein